MMRIRLRCFVDCIRLICVPISKKARHLQVVNIHSMIIIMIIIVPFCRLVVLLEIHDRLMIKLSEAVKEVGPLMRLIGENTTQLELCATVLIVNSQMYRIRPSGIFQTINQKKKTYSLLRD